MPVSRRRVTPSSHECSGRNRRAVRERRSRSVQSEWRQRVGRARADSVRMTWQSAQFCVKLCALTPSSEGRTACQQHRSPRRLRQRHDRGMARRSQAEPPLAATWSGRSRVLRSSSETPGTPFSCSVRTWAAVRETRTRNWYRQRRRCAATPKGPTSGCSRTSTSCAARSHPLVRLDARREKPPQPPELQPAGEGQLARLALRGPAARRPRNGQPVQHAPEVAPVRLARARPPALLAPEVPARPLARSGQPAPLARAAGARTRNRPRASPKRGGRRASARRRTNTDHPGRARSDRPDPPAMGDPTGVRTRAPQRPVGDRARDNSKTARSTLYVLVTADAPPEHATSFWSFAHRHAGRRELTRPPSSGAGAVVRSRFRSKLGAARRRPSPRGAKTPRPGQRPPPSTATPSRPGPLAPPGPGA